MACNLPVVSTPVGNVPDLFNNVSTCYMSSDFNAEQLAELANKVLTYSGNIDTRNDIIEKGLDLDSIGKRLFELYKKIVTTDEDTSNRSCRIYRQLCL